MASRFDSLPSEIHQQVFINLFNSTSDVCRYIFVCKRWNQFFQNILYTDVTIHSFLQLSKFLHTLETTQQLSSLVKRLTVCFTVDYEDEVKNSTITRLFSYLPNLEYIDCSNTIFLEFILDALSANQLPNLIRIEPPYNDEEIDDYIECATILKDRLTYLSITDPNAEDDEESDDEDSIEQINRGSAMFYRLFNILDEFKKVDSLSLYTKSDNDIELLEKVTKSCPLLDWLDICFIPRVPANTTNYINSINILNIIPATNISSLTFQSGVLHNSQLTQYVIHKFPQLKTLEIFGQTADRSFCLDQLIFKTFLDYLSKIRYVNIKNIPYKDQTLIDSIGPFWKNMSVSRTVSIELHYNSIDSDTDELAVRIDDSINTNIIRYSSSKNDINHSEVIAKYGQYIDSLIVYDLPGLLPEHMFYESLILLPLKYCIKLKQLSIVDNTLTGLEVPDDNFIIRKQTFDSLKLIDCVIKDNSILFEKLSKLFAHINYVEYEFIWDRDQPWFMNIHMKETKIGVLFLKTKSFHLDFWHKNYTLLIKLSTNQNYGYYMYDIKIAEDLVFKRIECQKFNNMCDSSKNFMFDLSFQSLEILQIEHFGRKLELPKPLFP